jgi:CHAD domain-containing protein
VAAKLQGRAAGTLEARRIVCKEILKAQGALGGKRLTDSAIHGARKSIKRARAVWRLLRHAFPAATYRQANARLRDAGRPLGAARDAKILVVALDKVFKGRGGLAEASALKTLRHGLIQNGSAIKHAVMLEPAGITLSRRALRSTYQRIKDCPIGERGWSVLGKGLRRTYARGRRMYHKARADRHAEHLHEWRKQVKYLHHQFAALKPLWPGPIGELASATGELSERLGDDHDLFVLCTRILAQSGAFDSAAQQGRMIAAIERERADLQNTAFMFAARIYEEKPADFIARFGGYWYEWRRTKTTAHGRRRRDCDGASVSTM